MRCSMNLKQKNNQLHHLTYNVHQKSLVGDVKVVGELFLDFSRPKWLFINLSTNLKKYFIKNILKIWLFFHMINVLWGYIFSSNTPCCGFSKLSCLWTWANKNVIFLNNTCTNQSQYNLLNYLYDKHVDYLVFHWTTLLKQFV